MSDLLNELNTKQREAVIAGDGPILILAGAGSGKTRCLAHRMAYLIQMKKVSPYHILAITFTNKAARELIDRVNRLLAISRPGTGQSGISKLPWMGTFHSICVKILRREAKYIGFSSNFSIYDSQDSLVLTKNVMKKLGIDIKQYSPQAVISFISGAKNELLGPGEYEKYANGHFQEIVTRVYKEYQSALRVSQAMDFDDLIMQTVLLLENNPEVLEKYQSLFKYILIDEYQDTNEAQYKLTKLLADKHYNICVVGDDYQAIYGWRGANFKNILNFEKDYPDAKVFKLEQNYRSTKNILEAAQMIIEKNRNRTVKDLWTDNVIGVPIVVFQGRSGEEESEFIISEMLALRQAGMNLNDFAILYRTNAQSRIFEESLLKLRVPYKVIGALRFYDRKEVKDILAYLRVIVNPLDEVSLRRIINVPSRGIGPKAQNSIRQLADKSQSENPKIQIFWKMIEGLREKSKGVKVGELIRLVLDMTGYKNFILDGTIEGQGRWENIEELMNVASLLDNLDEFLEQAALISDIDSYDESADAVTLMTMHSAKGLEFPTVFLAGMEEGIFPHSRSLMDEHELEEERRLCYVGITRAMKRLYLTYALTRIVYGGVQTNFRSRFIDDIPNHLIENLDY
ncbi:MAG: UvrD-helicase domain-containing protein [bacterium]|nr:UvrD-helicase domain-containing protein [bacterium]